MTDAHDFTLAELLEGIVPEARLRELSAVQRALPIAALAHDSRKVKPQTLFFCIPGAQSDGHDFARVATQAGATALVVERALPELDAASVPQIVVDDSRHALALVAARFYGQPSHRLRVTGITGTNGKTTSAYVLESLLAGAGRRTGLIGTVETRIAGVREPAERTTPDALELQQLLARMLAAGVSDVVMEVSSHALDLERVGAVRFAAVAFTNLSQDHLDWHHDMEHYFAAKKKLFTNYEAAARVINVDDAWGARLARELSEQGTPVFAVGACEGSSSSAAEPRDLAFDPAQVSYRPTKTAFSLWEPAAAFGCSATATAVQTPLVGAYNVHNVLIAAGCALCLGLCLEEVAPLLARVTAAPGRLEHVEAGACPFTVIVDYAHTDDALRTALGALRDVTVGRLITVFGCGGDRDRSKRPLMGRAAGQGSDYVIATSDNPRSEDPAAILAEVEAGLKETGASYEVIIDRATAIQRAVAMAQAEDCVFIAGKGHEDYQIFADRTIHFDDREVARAALAALAREQKQEGAQSCCA
ncbi:MAG: UDP-N-acetylmuramoyl-L-alanyl-D-glutamate--2,6-diaminopimelate ligase [Coriobacteriia bacterium]|nr:UDP-N-acetylmuramoyl-L-alanyl-D-glutamate--2,6-diaminopimelate ligase [Coriobacteriia bacterium]